MSEASLTTTESGLPHHPPLTAGQRRVLGVLIEKQKTSKSADAYPMTLNAITLGCNQKSNRDPITQYSEDEVEDILRELQQAGLVMKLTGGRADRWRHLLYDVWHVSKVELAILAELLLRGAQTEGDLRARASRMEEIPDLEHLRQHLASLSTRKFIIYLTEPGRRGTMLSHGFHTAAELERLKSGASRTVTTDEPELATATSSVLRDLEERLQTTCEELARLREHVQRLEIEVAALRSMQPTATKESG